MLLLIFTPLVLAHLYSTLFSINISSSNKEMLICSLKPRYGSTMGHFNKCRNTKREYLNSAQMRTQLYKEIIGKYSGCIICEYRGVIKEGVLNLTIIFLVCCCIICTPNQSHSTSWCSSDLLCCSCYCLVTKSCPALWTAWTKARQAPLFMRFPRQELWSGFHFLL